MTNLLCLILGSTAGGLFRYYLGGFVQRASGGVFPYGTLAVNLLGCLIAGFIVSAGEGRLPLSSSSRLLLITGFCGAFTTFSAFIVESDSLLKGGHALAGLLNVVLSVTLGFVLFRLGFFLGK